MLPGLVKTRSLQSIKPIYLLSLALNHHPAIQKISVHFWNAYLKDNAASKRWLKSRQAITATGLAKTDVWEWK